MTKLTNSKIKWLIRQVKKGEKISELASVMNVTPRRVQQLYKKYCLTGEMPMLKKERRPKTFLSEEQKQMVLKVHDQNKVGARLLKRVLDRDYPGNRIPVNKIHLLLKEQGLARPDPKKQKQRKRCRYERVHSGSLVHGDTHRTSENHPYCIVWLDDASRNAMSGIETDQPSTNETAIVSFKEAMRSAAIYNLRICQVNTDRGTEFFSNKKDMNKNSKSSFEVFLAQNEIQHIPSRVKNPQTNGKIERFWREYDKHRWRFASLDEFLQWYNKRIHGALMLEWGETPGQAFIRKLPPESLLGLFLRRID